MRTRPWVAAVLTASLAAGGCSRTNAPPKAITTTIGAPAAAAARTNPCSAPLQATDVGVTPSAIIIEVMADVGSPFTQGQSQDAFDAINAFAARVNARGGLACRQLKVRTWDSKLNDTESKNGQIDACQNAFAMVGNSAGLNTDISTLSSCADSQTGVAGLPDIPGFSSESTECGPTLFTVLPVTQACPVPSGDDTYTEQVGYMKWQLHQDPGLHGIYLIEGDLPALTVQEVPLMAAYRQAGMRWDAILKVFLTDTQTAYTPRVQVARALGSTFVFDGGLDTGLIFMRKEAEAQAATDVRVWACTFECYQKPFLEVGGKDIEGTDVVLNFLPFEEASLNPDEAAFVHGVGAANANLDGAYAWQAADAFQAAVNAVIAKGGPNSLTRASLDAALKADTTFDANGWAAPHALWGAPANSPCFVVVQVQSGNFVRVYPTTPGTMDCNPSNLATVTVDAASVAAGLK